MEWLSYLQ